MQHITRAEARIAGLKRYFTGKPCPRGHILERIVSTGACFGCLHGVTREERKAINKRRARLAKATPEGRAKRNRTTRLAKLKRMADPEVRLIEHRRIRRIAQSTPEKRLRRSLSIALYHALARADSVKTSSVIQVIGCPISFLAEIFQVSMRDHPTMCFDDRATWEVDHIVPAAAFDHSNPIQVAACWNWMNLRPLPPDENRDKSDKRLYHAR